MLRPPKRPRLHFLASVSPDPDGDLAIARARNDGLLKTRWENIFAKYEKDFEGIGDEISMLDDEIVVDNGHIKSMQNAQDTGVTRLVEEDTTSSAGYDGKRILRAMTVAPSENSQDSVSDDDADQVLQSIETIADNIVMDDESSEDDLFDTQPSNNASTYAGKYRERNKSEEVDIKSESDVDPLFDTRPVMRSPSVDDLFCTRSSISHPSDPITREPRSGPTKALTDIPDTTFGPVPPKSAIDRAFIREEIRKALEEENQAQEAQIEPAWRIPVRLLPQRVSNSASAPPPVPASPVIETADVLPNEEEMKNEDEESIWQVPTRTRRSKREIVAERSLKRLRAESEDPLQDGFTSDTEQPSSTSPRTTQRSPSRTKSRSSHDSYSARSSSLSLRKWQKPTTADPAEDDPLENERSLQRPSKKVRSFEEISREERKASNAPSSASDTIIVRVPEVQKLTLKKRPNG